MSDLFLVALPDLFSSPENMIRYGGLTLILAIVFVETGLLIGLVIPGGDSLLLATGLLAGADVLKVSVGVLLASMTAAGVAGDLLGYSIGKRMGKRLYKKQDTWYFKRKHLDRAEKFYREKGKSAIVLGKFVPVVRTFNPLLAGVTGMPLGRFLTLSFLGTALWICSLVLASYYLGQQFPQLKDYLHFAIPIIVLLSILPGVMQYLKERRKEAKV
ncbi:DedA family protein [Rufibacter latericius]|nr:VTT domain-containing protein [Rufibacter latericius]